MLIYEFHRAERALRFRAAFLRRKVGQKRSVIRSDNPTGVKVMNDISDSYDIIKERSVDGR